MAGIKKFGNRAIRRGGHTLILGWSEVAVELIKELSVANENVRKPRLVVLSPVSPVEVAASLSALELGRQKFRILQGDATSVHDLNAANANHAKSIIDLNSNLDALEKLVNGHAAKHPALAVAVEEILSFEGQEIYFDDLPALYGKTYADAVLAFNTAAVVGVVIDGMPVINPSADFVLPQDSQVIALAEDDDQVIYTGIREDALARLSVENPEEFVALTAGAGAGAGAGAADNSTDVIGNLKAKLLAQIGENPDLLSVFEGLFAADGASIGLLSVTQFASAGQPVEIADLAVAAISKGYSLAGYFGAASGGVALNPAKNLRITPAEGDALVVIGQFKA